MIKPDHKILYEQAESAVRTLIGDTRVPASQTRKELEELHDLIEEWIEGLEGE